MLCRATLSMMASMVRDRSVSPVELVKAHLQQIEERNPDINAFVMVLAEQALAEARQKEREAPAGPLHGVPVTVKDSFDVAGLPTRSGSRLVPDTPAANDATAVARFRRAGAIILGKTNTPEMLATYETDNLITGRTNLPQDLTRSPAGSSGGEAAAIAAFCSPGGIATDGGGSIRVPAHFCGIAGMKPSPGRVSGVGHFPSLGFPFGLLTSAGPMARNAVDLRLLFSVLAGHDPQDSLSAPLVPCGRTAGSARVGLWEQFHNVPVEPGIQVAVRLAGGLLAEAGCLVEALAPQGLERAPNVWAFLFSRWPASLRRKMVEGREAEAHWTLLESLDPSEPSGEEILYQLALRDRMRASLLRQMENVDALVMPVSSIPAFRHRERKWTVSGKDIGLFQAMMPAVLPNVLGLPAVAVPMAISEGGLPIGIQIVGRPFEDELILDLAIRLEERRGPVG